MLKIKCDNVQEFTENLPMLNALIRSDYDREKTAKESSSSSTKQLPTSLANSVNLTQRNKSTANLDNTVLDFSPQDVSNVSTR